MSAHNVYIPQIVTWASVWCKQSCLSSHIFNVGTFPLSEGVPIALLCPFKIKTKRKRERKEPGEDLCCSTLTEIESSLMVGSAWHFMASHWNQPTPEWHLWPSDVEFRYQRLLFLARNISSCEPQTYTHSFTDWQSKTRWQGQTGAGFNALSCSGAKMVLTHYIALHYT